jgi:hypothetical protein
MENPGIMRNAFDWNAALWKSFADFFINIECNLYKN